jgi:hypothetical protein
MYFTNKESNIADKNLLSKPITQTCQQAKRLVLIDDQAIIDQISDGLAINVDKAVFEMIKDLHQLDLMCRNNRTVNSEIQNEELEDMEFFIQFFKQGIQTRNDLRSKLKKTAFCRICKIHPRTKDVPLSFIENYYETVVNHAN